MTHIHLDEAYWCENCQCITDDSKKCPSCANESNLLPMNTFVPVHPIKKEVKASCEQMKEAVSNLCGQKDYYSDRVCDEPKGHTGLHHDSTKDKKQNTPLVQKILDQMNTKGKIQ